MKRLPEASQLRFLALLSDGFSVTSAARTANIARRTLYDARDRDAVFRAAWDEAVEAGADRIQDEVRDRALDRNDAKSATLLIFLLKGLRPQFKENFRDRPIQIEHVKEISFSKKEMDEAIDILTRAKGATEVDEAGTAPASADT